MKEAVINNDPVNKIKRVGAFEKRVHEVDFLRGLLMIIVILDHLFLRFWQLGFAVDGPDNILYKIFSFYWYSDARSVIRPMVLFGFTFISGISCAFSKSNKKRAALMLIVYCFVLIFTNILQIIVGGGMRIDFNVIGVLAFSTLFYCLVEKRSWKTLASFSLIAVFMTAYFIPFLTTFPTLVHKVYAPMLWNPSYLRAAWDSTLHSFIFVEDGFVTMGVPQGDHMPFFPYVGFFFMGALISRFVYKQRKSIFKHRFEFERPICFVGRHALWFYLGHQVFLFPVFTLLEKIL